MVDRKNFFDQPIKSEMKVFDNIRKITTDQWDNYTTGCLLDYNYFKKYHKIIAIDLIKKQALDAGPKEVQQINFAGNLKRGNGAIMLFIIGEAKETISYFSQKTMKVFRMCCSILFCFDIVLL